MSKGKLREDEEEARTRTGNELYIGQATSDSGCCSHRMRVCGKALNVVELRANASAKLSVLRQRHLVRLPFRSSFSVPARWFRQQCRHWCSVMNYSADFVRLR